MEHTFEKQNWMRVLGHLDCCCCSWRIRRSWNQKVIPAFVWLQIGRDHILELDCGHNARQGVHWVVWSFWVYHVRCLPVLSSCRTKTIWNQKFSIYASKASKIFSKHNQSHADAAEAHVPEVGPVAVGGLLTGVVVPSVNIFFFAYLDGLTTEGLTNA